MDKMIFDSSPAKAIIAAILKRWCKKRGMDARFGINELSVVSDPEGNAVIKGCLNFDIEMPSEDLYSLIAKGVTRGS